MSATEIYWDVLAAMQPAEEMGGHAGASYLDLMERIEREARNRAAAYRAAHPEDLETLRRRNAQLADALREALDDLESANATFGESNFLPAIIKGRSVLEGVSP